MALNHRRQALISSENAPVATLAAKNATTKNTGLVQRQALGEIKNKLLNVTNAKQKELTKKQPPVLGVLGQKVAKTSSTTNTTTIAQKEIKKVANKENDTIVTLKKSSENVIIDKIETVCVISSEGKSYSTQRMDRFEDEEEGIYDPQFVAEYISDIFAYLRSLEMKFPIDELFLACHRTTNRMRCVLINWLVEVHSNFKMLPETLHLTVQVLDRYLQKNKSVGRDNLQLVGLTALWIASKYEEMYIPEIGDFVYFADEAFTAEEMKTMELLMIKALDYSFGRPLSLHFLRRYSKVAKAQTEHHALAKYFLELALLEYELCHIRPSLQAAAAIYLALSILNNRLSPSQIWTRAMIHYSTYTFTEIEKTVKLMATAVLKAETSKYQAIRSKYANAVNGKVSLYPELKGTVITKFAQK